MNEADIQAGLDQMNYEQVDNGVIEIPSSKPARYGFVEPATYDPEAFKEACEEYGFSVFTATTEQRGDGDFYYYVGVLTDHYKKVHVRVWRETACIFPKEKLVDTYEFARIVRSIESAFGDLEHEPDTGSPRNQ